MINEKVEVESYLNGENLNNHDCSFRMCYLMAQYFLEQGKTPLEVRRAIFDWGNKYGVYISHSVNDTIKLAIANGEHLCQNTIKISDEDIQEINLRFGTRNSRLCALGILLFAKAHADANGVVNFSQADFANWVHIKQPNVSKTFSELELFDYIEKIYPMGDQTFFWSGNIVGKRVRYKLKVPTKNEGNYELKDNDILNLYNQIWGKEEKC